jgi:hypothetical protein
MVVATLEEVYFFVCRALQILNFHLKHYVVTYEASHHQALPMGVKYTLSHRRYRYTTVRCRTDEPSCCCQG